MDVIFQVSALQFLRLCCRARRHLLRRIRPCSSFRCWYVSSWCHTGCISWCARQAAKSLEAPAVAWVFHGKYNIYIYIYIYI